jgi:hypothetical protein
MGRPRSHLNRDLPDNLYRRPDGRFYFRDPRTSQTFALGRDEAAARAEAAEVNERLSRITVRRSLIHRVRGCAPQTVAAWLGRYEELLAADPSLSAATLKQYRSLNRQLCEVLGDRVLTELRPHEIAPVLGRWRTEGRQTRGHSLLAHLRRACAAAIGDGWLPIGCNPTEGLRMKKPTVRRQRLTLEDFHRLHAAAATHEPWVRRWLELAVVTTLRIADLLAISWRRMPDSSGWVDDAHLRVRTAKRGVPLAIPLGLTLPPAGSWSIGSVLADIEADGVSSAWVIRRTRRRPNAPAGSPIRPRTAEEVFAELLVAAGVELQPGRTRPTPHELRSLGLRLHRVCHGREFARHLGSHESEHSADIYQDPRGAGWLVIPLPPRPDRAKLAAAVTAVTPTPVWKGG